MSSAKQPTPQHIDQVPMLRRSSTCSAMILGWIAAILLSGCVPVVSLIGAVLGIGVIVVCVMVLTGPIYYKGRRKDGTLKTWSNGNKIAAVIILVIFLGLNLLSALIYLGVVASLLAGG